MSKSSSQTGTQKRENKKNNVNKSHSKRNKYLKVHDDLVFISEEKDLRRLPPF